jgi:hypothetical protein
LEFEFVSSLGFRISDLPDTAFVSEIVIFVEESPSRGGLDYLEKPALFPVAKRFWDVTRSRLWLTC